MFLKGVTLQLKAYVGRWTLHLAYCAASPPPILQRPLMGQGLLIVEASRSHSDTSHGVELLWTSDKLDSREFYLTTHNIHKR